MDRLVVYAGPAIGAYRVRAGLRLAALRFSVRPTERNAKRFDRGPYATSMDSDAAVRTGTRRSTAYSRSQSLVPHVKQTMNELLRDGTKRIPNHQLDRISCPTALLWGRHDRMVPLSLAQAARGMAGHFSSSTGAGHVPHVEQPEAFVPVLAEIEFSPMARYLETS